LPSHLWMLSLHFRTNEREARSKRQTAIVISLR
jgi:hypothetical protein